MQVQNPDDFICRKGGRVAGGSRKIAGSAAAAADSGKIEELFGGI